MPKVYIQCLLYLHKKVNVPYLLQYKNSRVEQLYVLANGIGICIHRNARNEPRSKTEMGNKTV